MLKIPGRGVYEGEFNQNHIHGNGTMKYEDGNVY